ncbi:uncharacterized protein LOC133914653 [Phragmites australis]|uniref:uncharacterized protein LOC133914653 n=1 Tax=Phragmites australis TaxID=29695 RepID=UPI002D779F58|nr:uncharacterized protein LOC133914653 [Phragmites australis]
MGEKRAEENAFVVLTYNRGSNSIGEAAASDKKDSTEKDGAGESKELSLTNNNADEVKKGCENGTEGAADGDVSMVEADDVKECDSGCDKVVGAADLKMADTEHGANIEAVDDAKAANEDINMVEAKIDARNEEVKENGKKEKKEDKIEEKQNDANIQAKDEKMVDKEDACQKEDTEGMSEDSQDAKVTEGEDINMVEANIDARNDKVKENGENEDKTEEKQNDANI